MPKFFKHVSFKQLTFFLCLIAAEFYLITYVFAAHGNSSGATGVSTSSGGSPSNGSSPSNGGSTAVGGAPSPGAASTTNSNGSTGARRFLRQHLPQCMKKQLFII